ncbi:NnrS family protein [Rhodoplanes roseus]|uniref:NnrS family protein n=1 Tax=Rhodoplanes roseus TaxID=29409 RepID=UPI0014728E70|nr:NnrS family protein [Rhodoplanes roseus]
MTGIELSSSGRPLRRPSSGRLQAARRPAPHGASFRVFFLAGALQAVLVIGLWGAAFPLLAGIDPPLAPAAWHAHELLFGYVPAVQAGFLLTAIPHWTGRRPVGGGALAALLALWIAGRLAAAGLLGLSPLGVALLAIAFTGVLAGLVTVEIIAARSVDNAPAVLSLIVLAVAEILFHADLAAGHEGATATRLALAGVTAQMMLLGGRIVPAFTRDYLAETGRAPLPPSLRWLDGGAVGLGLAALVVWLALPPARPLVPASGAVLLAAGGLLLVRQARWAPSRTRSEPLVWVLHLGAAMTPLGLLMAGAGALTAETELTAAAVHVWAVGGIGLMTLALMTRVSLGHTGRPLRAGSGSAAIYLALAVAAVARAGSILAPQWTLPLLPLAGVAWIAAYAGFLVLYGPMLLRPAVAAERAAHSPPR